MNAIERFYAMSRLTRLYWVTLFVLVAIVVGTLISSLLN
jgi:hypothetical protein